MGNRAAWLMLCLAATALAATALAATASAADDDEPPLLHDPRVERAAPPRSSGFMVLDDDGPSPSVLHELQHHLTKLKAERRQLADDHDKAAARVQDKPGPDGEEAAKLRLHLGELLTRMGTRKERPRVGPLAAPPVGPTKPVAPPVVGIEPPDKKGTPAPPTPKSAPPTPDVAKAIDALALAQALFRAGNYEGAMKAYRLLPQDGLKAEERAPLQYMIATCLKKTGKLDEAATIYREVANSKGDEHMAQCAQWQLGALRWHREVEDKLKEIRQRRKALDKQ